MTKLTLSLLVSMHLFTMEPLRITKKLKRDNKENTNNGIIQIIEATNFVRLVRPEHKLQVVYKRKPNHDHDSFFGKEISRPKKKQEIVAIGAWYREGSLFVDQQQVDGIAQGLIDQYLDLPVQNFN